MPFLKLLLTCVSFSDSWNFIHNGCTDKVGTKGNAVAVAGLVAVDDSTKAEFKGHAAVTESVALQTATETGLLVAEAAAWL